MAKSGGSASVQRKLRGLDVGAVTYNKGAYTVNARGGQAGLETRLALQRAGLRVVSERPLNEYAFNGWREIIARRG